MQLGGEGVGRCMCAIQESVFGAARGSDFIIQEGVCRERYLVVGRVERCSECVIRRFDVIRFFVLILQYSRWNHR